jgi:sortase A
MRLLSVLGRMLLCLGALVLLFMAYQLWGTGVTEAHSQSVLKAALDRELPRTERRALAALVASQPPAAPRVVETAPRTSDPHPGKPIGEIDIPSIGLHQVVVEGVQEPDLAMGPGHYPGTSLPGQPGNAAIAGHRTTYAHPFYNLTAVRPGAEILITTPQGVFAYRAQGESVVSPADLTVLRESRQPSLTLTTCNPRYSAATRLVLRATLARSLLFSPALGRPSAGPQAKDANALRPPPSPALPQPSSGSWVRAVFFAAPVAVVLAAMVVARRRRAPRWAVLVPGTAATLVALWFFFGAVSPLLPASF